MRQNGQKVYGPYPHRTKFRLVVVKADGAQEALSFETEAKARAHKRELLKDIEGRTVSDAVQAYVMHLRDNGRSFKTATRSEFHLRSFFVLDGENDGVRIPFLHAGGLLQDLRAKTCEKLYAELTKRHAVDTHRNTLAVAKAFGVYCVKRGWLAANPLADIVAVGKRNRGKPQLRLDEARLLVDVCIREANQGDEAAIAVLTAFLMGMRASEVTDRVVRDLDDSGRLLWIDKGKTRRSRRALEVPAVLRPYLLAQAEGRAPDAQLISRTTSKQGAKRERFWLLYHVERLCRLAKVPKVCTHSLRGLHASVATDAGATAHVVAAALGHTSPAVTQAHYIDQGTADRARTRRVLERLEAPANPVRSVGNG